jgi:hypothetical protein
VLLYLLARPWDEATGSNFKGAFEAHLRWVQLRCTHPSLTPLPPLAMMAPPPPCGHPRCPHLAREHERNLGEDDIRRILSRVRIVGTVKQV